ncbi:MAG: hypothetical protein V2J62_05855 [candidate division KSB1 bacterium]|jgi:hypothetical protein|nr:hypothetical protein [candidate division KSB1 bacterium]
MDYRDLLEKYNLLLDENSRLIEENDRLKVQLGITNHPSPEKRIVESITPNDQSPDRTSFSDVNHMSDSTSKIKLFMSLFKGREDVYAKKWENKKKAKSGFSPACLNQWQVGLCGKPKTLCSKCSNQLYAALDEHVIENHLRGSIIAGIYPMLLDETCHFLAIDFDEACWQEDVTAVREVCTEFDIPVAAERSQSGNGAHLWFFFENQVTAFIQHLILMLIFSLVIDS